MNLETVLDAVDQCLEDSLERLFDFLRIPSISTDPAYIEQCKHAAAWLHGTLEALGFDTEVVETSGQAMVLAQSPSLSRTAPADVLFYGHYDVQPVTPLSEWNHPPFEPRLEHTEHGAVIRARGASDDKGQLLSFIEACRAWTSVQGSLPLSIRMFFEGEEECGSPSLPPFLHSHGQRLAARLALVCDTTRWDRQTPAIVTRLRGQVGEEICIHGPSRDLHSGHYGGVAINPIRVLCSILAELQDPISHRIRLPGFYDGIINAEASQRADWAALQHDDNAFLAEVGLNSAVGEADYSLLERLWMRPSLDINGIDGGYTGEGFKTVLPAMARCKLSFRLVEGQDPERIRQSLYSFVQARLPEGCRVEFKSKPASAAIVMDTQSDAFAAARQALQDEWGSPAVMSGAGGSIPVVGHFKRALGMDSMLIGFALEDDAIHSPNEKYDVMSFHKAIRSWVRIIDKLAQNQSA